MKRTKAQEAEREESLKRVRAFLEVASKDRDGRPIAYTILRHVARSGMQRCISVALIVDGDLAVIDRDVARILGDRVNQKHGGVIVPGAGMDMGFHLVYNLSGALYGHADRGGYRLLHRWV